MWFELVLAMLVACALLYVPGFMLAYALVQNPVSALAYSPLITISGYEIIAVVASAQGMRLEWYWIPIAVTAAGLLVLLLKSFFLSSRIFGASVAIYDRSISHRRPLLLLYFAISVGLGAFFFLKTLDGAASFNQGPDNGWHLGLIETFSRTGDYSPLSTTLYPAEEGLVGPAGSFGSFYPAAWHCWTSFVSQAVGVSTTIAANATLSVLLMVVFPSSVFALICQIFPAASEERVAGAFCGMAFSAFPWMLLYFGPLYPNFASLVFAPLVAASFIAFVESKAGDKFSWICLFLFGICSLVFLQTNSVFTVALFMFPFCVYRLFAYCSEKWGRRRPGRGPSVALAVCCGFVLLVFFGWYYIGQADFMAGVTSYEWLPYTSLRQELINIFTLAYRAPQAQLCLGLLVVVGAISMIRKRRYAWIVAAYAIACLMLLVAATSENEWDRILNGFWYTDPYRLAANAAIIAIPIASAGFASVFRMANKLIARLKGLLGDDLPPLPVTCSEESNSRGLHVRWRCSSWILFGLLFFVLNFYPDYEIPGMLKVHTAFGEIEDSLYRTNASIDTVLDKDELDFLRKVKEVVGDDLVINIPDDGSLFAYAAFGINVYYRQPGLDGYNSDSEISKLYRNHLNEITGNHEVSDAVDLNNAVYVLQLDCGETAESRYYYDNYYETSWTGISSITPDTPGFSLILHEGDMYLYKIAD